MYTNPIVIIDLYNLYYLNDTGTRIIALLTVQRITNSFVELQRV